MAFGLIAWTFWILINQIQFSIRWTHGISNRFFRNLAISLHLLKALAASAFFSNDWKIPAHNAFSVTIWVLWFRRLSDIYPLSTCWWLVRAICLILRCLIGLELQSLSFLLELNSIFLHTLKILILKDAAHTGDSFVLSLFPILNVFIHLLDIAWNYFYSFGSANAEVPSSYRRYLILNVQISFIIFIF